MAMGRRDIILRPFSCSVMQQSILSAVNGGKVGGGKKWTDAEISAILMRRPSLSMA
jgi:hypothetical protein